MEKYYKARLKYINSEIKDTYRAMGIKKAVQIRGISNNKIYGGEGNYKLINDMKWLNFLCGESTKKKEIVKVSDPYNYHKMIEEEKEVEDWLWAIGLDTILTISDGKAKDIWTGKVYKCEPIEKIPEKNSSDFDLSDFVLKEYTDKDCLTGDIYSKGFKFERQRSNTKEESFNGFHQ